jgi:hypothetical protein
MATRVQKIEELHKFFEQEMPSIVDQVREALEAGEDLFALSVKQVKEGRRVVRKVVLIQGLKAFDAPYWEEEVSPRSNPKEVARSLVDVTIDVLLAEARTK